MNFSIYCCWLLFRARSRPARGPPQEHGSSSPPAAPSTRHRTARACSTQTRTLRLAGDCRASQRRGTQTRNSSSPCCSTVVAAGQRTTRRPAGSSTSPQRRGINMRSSTSEPCLRADVADRRTMRKRGGSSAVRQRRGMQMRRTSSPACSRADLAGQRTRWRRGGCTARRSAGGHRCAVQSRPHARARTWRPEGRCGGSATARPRCSAGL